MPATSFQSILDTALAEYHEQIGIELDKHPFSHELRGRDSPDDVLKLLEDKANTFKAYRDGNRKLINWLNPVVQVIHTLSGVLGQVVTPTREFNESNAIALPLDPFSVWLPGSIPTSTGDLCWRGCPNHGTCLLTFPTCIYSDPHTPGSQRSQFELRCTR